MTIYRPHSSDITVYYTRLTMYHARILNFILTIDIYAIDQRDRKLIIHLDVTMTT